MSRGWQPKRGVIDMPYDPFQRKLYEAAVQYQRAVDKLAARYQWKLERLRRSKKQSPVCAYCLASAENGVSCR